MQKRDIKVLSVSKSTLQSLIERPKKSSGFQTGEFTGFSRRRAQIPTAGGQAGMDTQGWKQRKASFRSADGGFILHLIQRSFGIDCILIRLELVTQALNSNSFCGLMVSQ